MAYYRVCPKCRANLDPGEHCTCEEREEEKKDFFSRHLRKEPDTGQFAFMFGGDGTGQERKSRC